MSKQPRSTPLGKRLMGGALIAAGGALVALKAVDRAAKSLRDKAKKARHPSPPRAEQEAIAVMEGEGGGSKLDPELAPSPKP